MPNRSEFGRSDFSVRSPAQEQIHILSHAVQQSPNAVLIARADGVIEYVNPSFTRLTGYLPVEVIGNHPELSSAQRLSPMYRGLRGILREGRDWRGEIKGKKKSGETYWALESITPIHGPDGRITHFLVIRQDITQQKLSHHALQESEERFRQIADMTGEWLWELDPQGVYLYSSAAVKDILGYFPEEIIGRNYAEFLLMGEQADESDQFPGLFDQGRGFCHLLNSYRHKDGHKVFTESTASPLFVGKSGQVLKWRGVDHNITARKYFEDELRLRNRAMEEASVGISIVDATFQDFPMIYVNPALCKLTGYGREELLGKNLRMLQGPETDPRAVAEISSALGQEEGCQVTLKNYRKNGTTFWNELQISPVRDETGRLTHYIGIQTDVTERRHSEEQRHELEIARKIQLSLLPKVPLNLPRVRVFGVCVPASHVGGDYFDYFIVKDEVHIVIADVSGHSVGSALIMAEARSTLKAEARQAGNGADNGPAETLRMMNELLFEDLDGADLFISMFYLRYHPKTRLLRYACAGHNPALLLCANAAACNPLDAEGMVMGVKREVAFEERSLALAPGDRLLLYTDGIVEARDEAGEFYGVDQLVRFFASSRARTPQAQVDLVLKELRGYTSGKPLEDDCTLVAVQIT